MKTANLSILIGIVGASSQLFLSTPSYAQSAAEQQICQKSGKYVAFAQTPLRGLNILPEASSRRNSENLEFSHEHIFVCHNGKITDDIGFGRTGRGPYLPADINKKKWKLVDSIRYDIETIHRILEPANMCLYDGEYNLTSNNCQHFAERVRNEYWKRIFVGTWEAQQLGNKYQMLVDWNSSKKQYEGILIIQGEGSKNVGFSIGELVWTAKLVGDSKMSEQQKWRRGRDGVSSGSEWRDGVIYLERSSVDKLVTTTGTFYRVRNSSR
jgi:hypothetical protein